jgi:hypothetical protein
MTKYNSVFILKRSEAASLDQILKRSEAAIGVRDFFNRLIFNKYF